MYKVKNEMLSELKCLFKENNPKYIMEIVNYTIKNYSRYYDSNIFMDCEVEDIKSEIEMKLDAAKQNFAKNKMDEFLCKYSKTLVHNFFCSEAKKRIIRLNLRIKIYDLIEQYGEENYLTSLQQKIECSKICTVEEEIVYNPIPDEVMDKLSPINKELLRFILKRKSISAKSYANAFSLKLDTADRRIRRFRHKIKKEMLQWLRENPEEAKLMQPLLYYCNSH